MAEFEKLVAPYAPVAVNGLPNAANSLSERLGRTVRYPASGGQVTFDLGSPRPVDTIAVLATNYVSTTLWAVLASNNANMTQPIQDTGAILVALPGSEKRLHRQGLLLLPAPVTARYWQVQFSNQAAGFDIDVGRVVIGQSFTAADTADLGYSFKVVDLGESRRSTTALENNTIRGKVLEYSWTWSWMSEAEARGDLLDIQAYAGTTRDVLLIFNPDAPDLHNVIGYGKMIEEVESVNVAGGIDIDNAYEAKFRLQSRLILNL